MIAYYQSNPLEGYRRLSYMMIDEDVAYVSPSTTYRILKASQLLASRKFVISKKGTGFNQPALAHAHWHTDFTYIKIGGELYHLILLLDGFSRFIVAWDITKVIDSNSCQVVIQKGKELFPGATPRIISDNGKQFTSKEFQSLLAQVGMTHVTTSPYYPQSNGKLERCNKTIKSYLRTRHIADLKEALKVVGAFIEYYNTKRLHSAISFVTPQAKLLGKAQEIIRVRTEKLEVARAERLKINLAQKNLDQPAKILLVSETNSPTNFGMERFSFSEAQMLPSG